MKIFAFLKDAKFWQEVLKKLCEFGIIEAIKQTVKAVVARHNKRKDEPNKRKDEPNKRKRKPNKRKGNTTA